MKIFAILTSLLLLLITATVSLADDTKPLQGNVKQSRVQRPATQSLHSGTSKTGITDGTFKKIKSGKDLAGFSEFEGMPLDDSTLTAPSKSWIPPPSKTSSEPSTPKPEEIRSDKNGKEITIRLKRFRSLQEMEVVWEATNLATIMQRKGAHVTILLDMDAVHAANRHDTSFTEFQLHRGGGNTSERLQSVQQLLRNFIDAGGEVIVNQRWAHLNAMDNGGSMIPGTKLVTDEEIADHLLNTSNILDY